MHVGVKKYSLIFFREMKVVKAYFPFQFAEMIW